MPPSSFGGLDSREAKMPVPMNLKRKDSNGTWWSAEDIWTAYILANRTGTVRKLAYSVLEASVLLEAAKVVTWGTDVELRCPTCERIIEV